LGALTASDAETPGRRVVAATPRRLARAEIFMIMMMEKNRSSMRSRGVVFDGDSRCVGCTQVKPNPNPNLAVERCKTWYEERMLSPMQSYSS
jgi:hypothetical protein